MPKTVSKDTDAMRFERGAQRDFLLLFLRFLSLGGTGSRSEASVCGGSLMIHSRVGWDVAGLMAWEVMVPGRSVTLLVDTFFFTFLGSSLSRSPAAPATAGNRSMLFESDLRVCLLERLLGVDSTLVTFFVEVTTTGDLGCTYRSQEGDVVMMLSPGLLWLA